MIPYSLYCNKDYLTTLLACHNEETSVKPTTQIVAASYFAFLFFPLRLCKLLHSAMFVMHLILILSHTYYMAFEDVLIGFDRKSSRT